MMYVLFLLALTQPLLAETPGAGIAAPPITTQSAAKTPASVIVPIDIMLRAVRDGSLEKAYTDTTSSEFKAATSFEDFKAFLEKHPAIAKHKSLEVKLISMQSEEASLTVTLNPNKDPIPVNFLLAKENGVWKIWHLSVTPLYSDDVMRLFKDSATMHQPIEGQLEAVKQDNILKAYQTYNSEKFKQLTSLEAFRAFLKDFPVFMNYKEIHYKEPIMDKGMGLQEIELSTDEMTSVIDYTLGIEDEQWKIWKIQVVKQVARVDSSLQPQTGPPLNVRVTQTKQPEGKEQKKGPMEFGKIEIGSRSSVNGSPQQNVKNLSLSQGEIYANLTVNHGTFGSKIKLDLNHTESNTNVPSVSTMLEQDGNVEISFAFTPPPAGWPKGHYNLKITSSTGLVKTVPFTID